MVKIKFKGSNKVKREPSSSSDTLPLNIPLDTDPNNWELKVHKTPGSIKGIIITKTLNGVEIDVPKREYELNDNGMISIKDTDTTLIDKTKIKGFFHYIRSEQTVEEYGFQLYFHFSEDQKKAIEISIAKRINSILDEEALERLKN